MNVPQMSKLHRWVSLLILLFAQFVIAIDLTVLNVALPSMTAELRPTSDEQLWIVDAYSLVLAGLLVSASSLSDRFGRKKMLLLGALVFCVGSGLIMFANTPIAVIGIRAFLGLGAAMMMPTTISMIRNIFTDARERAFALGAWSVLGALGMALGPIIGGALLEFTSWHSAFLINIPLMAIVLVAGTLILPEIKVETVGPWDVVAALVSLVGMTLLMWSIKHTAAIMAFDVAGVAAFVVGLAAMVLFVVRCLRSSSPLMDVTLFKSRTFTAGILVALGSMFSIASLLFLISQWLQLVDGNTPLEAGVKLLPMAVVELLAGAITPALAMRFNARRVLVGGLAIGAIAMLMLVFQMGNLTYLPIAISCGFVGVGSGVLAVGSAAIMCETPPEKASSAAAFEEISYDLGNVLGVAIMGSLASIVYRLGLNPERLTEAGLSQDALDQATQSFSAAVEIAQETGVVELLNEGMQSFSDSVVITAAIGGIIMVIITLITYRLVPKDLDITKGEH